MTCRLEKVPAIVVISGSALPVARKLANSLPKSEIHGLLGRINEADVLFKNTRAHLQVLFQRAQPIVGLCGSGILIRALAPLLLQKSSEPPVIAVAQDGSIAVPLLGSHRGGNRIATEISNILNSTIAITTASETNFGVALDDPPAGYHLQNPQDLKHFTAQLLSGSQIQPANLPRWIMAASPPLSKSGTLQIISGIEKKPGGPNQLIFTEEVLALGVGCERNCDPGELQSLVEKTFNEANLSLSAIGVIVSVDLKCDEPAMLKLGATLDRPVRFFHATRLESEKGRIRNPSDTVFQAVGCHGVAESAALTAAGSESDLFIEKQKSDRATCAIARSINPIDAIGLGRARGQLAIVGLGPGGTGWRTLEAETLLAQSTDFVGYGGYLDQLGPAMKTKTLHKFPLGKEIERVQAALDLAAQGRIVSLVSSGDPGIYAMGALVFETIHKIAKPEWRWVDIKVSPGISALQGAAARIGAPLGNDFCAISLSDLLTPSCQIKKRLKAAASSDFIIALYNPASNKRRSLLKSALKILSKHRSLDTPLVIARQLGRPEETIHISTLKMIDPNKIDMFTVLLVGSNQTRKLDNGCGLERVYTPRGYATKFKENLSKS